MAVSRTKDSKKKGGKLHIYLLFEKNFDKTCLKDIENQTGCFATRIYPAGKGNGFYSNNLAQLLINSLHEKAIKRDYGNGDGMLLYSHPKWTNDYKGEFYRYGIQVKVEFNNIIALPVVTFKRSEKGNFFWDDKHSKMTKMKSVSQNKMEKYEQKEHPEVRNSVPFFSIEDRQKFERSKNGIFVNLLEDIETYLSDYLQVTLREAEPSTKKVVRYKKEKLIERLVNDLEHQTIHFIDLTETKEGSETNRILAKKLQQEIPDLVIKCESKPQIGFNLCYLLPKEEYEKGDLKDPHLAPQPGKVIQHFTRESLSKEKLEKLNGNILNCPEVLMILLELIVKQDIQAHQMNPDRLVLLEGQLPISFVKRTGAKEEVKLVAMTIEKSGTIIFDQIDEETFKKGGDFENPLWCSYEKHLASSKISKEQLWSIETFIQFSNGCTTTVKSTKLLLLPDGQRLHRRLSEVRNSNVPTKHLIEAISNIQQKSNEKIDPHALAEIKEKLMGGLATCHLKDYKDYFTGKTAIGKEMNAEIVKLFGYRLYSNIRAGEFKMEYDPFFNINYFERIDFMYDKNPHYSVGSPKGSTQVKYERANTVREIKYIGEVFPKEFFLKMMEVDFVRIGKLTVWPFPLKYLNTYISEKKL
ncbi:hypothetical protein RV10_GL001485 [Enterococcus pallens]|nr:hypothetical protein RV10_GL001485 [Enterococcus pallens]